MRVIETPLPGVLVIEPKVFEDDRGFFMEAYETRKYRDHGITDRFVQDNHSGSCGGTLRGLHYQLRHAQGKLVRVVAGSVFDVAVDLRRPSPAFGQWHGTELSAKNRRQIWIPAGFAHGFYVTSDWAEVEYKVTDLYAPEWERTLLWNDPALGIAWPIDEGQQPLLSEKDKAGQPLEAADVYERDPRDESPAAPPKTARSA